MIYIIYWGDSSLWYFLIPVCGTFGKVLQTGIMGKSTTIWDKKSTTNCNYLF